MKRKPGALLPLEQEILAAGLRLRGAGAEGFHGFQLAQALADDRSAKRLTSHGTLYKALRRLEAAGLLQSVWEDAARALEEGRPRRRLYHVTGPGARAAEQGRTEPHRFHAGTPRPSPAS